MIILAHNALVKQQVKIKYLGFQCKLFVDLGPNSPIKWVKKCVEILDPESKHRNQILLGLNFYGNDYSINGGGPIVGSQYIDILKNHTSVKFQWDDNSQEHFFEYK